VRIALALKGVSVETQPINIFGVEAESRQPDYRRVNPQGLVPALLTDEGTLITQSLAIVEYLDELHPEPSLLPENPEAKAFSRSIALAIASEIHALLPPEWPCV
jgi:maleylpyruvate isomerase